MDGEGRVRGDNNPGMNTMMAGTHCGAQYHLLKGYSVDCWLFLLFLAGNSTSASHTLLLIESRASAISKIKSATHSRQKYLILTNKKISHQKTEVCIEPVSSFFLLGGGRAHNKRVALRVASRRAYYRNSCSIV